MFYFLMTFSVSKLETYIPGLGIYISGLGIYISGPETKSCINEKKSDLEWSVVIWLDARKKR